jgi:hypothetical protein
MTASSPQQAVANGHNVSSYDSGMCQKFVRDQCWRVPSLYGSAIEAWNGARYKHPGDRTPPVGAPTYYRGGNYGHAVIFCGQGHTGMRSTDCTSTGRVSDAAISWVENNWGYTYLGWTEDINGVRVIVPDEQEDEVKDEDIQAIAARVNRALGDYNADGDKEQGTDGDMADKRLRQIENTVRQIEDKVNRLLDQ